MYLLPSVFCLKNSSSFSSREYIIIVVDGPFLRLGVLGGLGGFVVVDGVVVDVDGVVLVVGLFFEGYILDNHSISTGEYTCIGLTEIPFFDVITTVAYFEDNYNHLTSI